MTGSRAARRQLDNRITQTTASGRLPVVQLENRESAHFERLLTTAAVIRITRKTILRRTGPGQEPTFGVGGGSIIELR